MQRLKVHRRRRSILRANTLPLDRSPIVTSCVLVTSPTAKVVFDRPIRYNPTKTAGITVGSRTVLSAAWSASTPTEILLTMSGTIAEGDLLDIPPGSEAFASLASGAFVAPVQNLPMGAE